MNQKIPGTRREEFGRLLTRLKPLVLRFTGLSVARVVAMGIGVFTIAISARWIGVEDYGRLAVASAIITTTSAMFSLGLPIFALRAAALGHSQATGYALFLNLSTSLAGALVGFGIAIFTGSLNTLLIALIAASTAFEKNTEVRIGLGTEFGKSKIVNIIIIARSLVWLGLMLIFHLFGFTALTSFLIARLSAAVLAAALLAISVTGWPLTIKRPTDNSLDILGSLATQKFISSWRFLDVSIIGIVAGPIEAGLYSAVQRLMMPVISLGDNLRTVITGEIVRGSEKRARRNASTFLAIIIATTILFGILSIWSTPLIELVLGNEFTSGADALRWGILAIPPAILVGLYLTILQDKGLSQWTARATGLNIAMALGGALIGSYLYGATGAMFAYFFSFWVFALIMYWKTRSIGRDKIVIFTPPISEAMGIE